MYIVRQSEHIHKDVQRNFSSWNYGQLGFEGTENELKASMDEAFRNDHSFDISGFELWEDEIHNADIRELYDGYWVLVDNTRGFGLSCNILDSETLTDAIEEVRTNDIELGEGETVDCSGAKIVWSDAEKFIHILEIKS